MKFLRDRRGTAYSIILIIATFVLISVVWIFASPMMNDVFSTVNTQLIDTGTISTRTQDTIEFNRMMFNLLPFVFAFVLLFLYPILRALMERRAGD